MPFCPVIFHQAHTTIVARPSEIERKTNENNTFTHSTKQTKQQPTLAAILTNDSLSHACLHFYTDMPWNLYGCTRKSIELFGGFTYRICANKNLCKSTTHVCNNWQIKRNGKSFFSFVKHESRKYSYRGRNMRFRMMKNEHLTRSTRLFLLLLFRLNCEMAC